MHARSYVVCLQYDNGQSLRHSLRYAQPMSYCKSALKRQIVSLSGTEGVLIDPSLHTDLQSAMEENHATVMCENPEGSFVHVFWQQQQEAARQHDARTMQWHPQMIRWCLHFQLKLSGAYKLLRESGIVKLPSD